MKDFIYLFVIIIVLMLLAMFELNLSRIERNTRQPIKVETTNCESEILLFPDSILTRHPKECIRPLLNYFDIKYPNVVEAQARLESAHFTSDVFYNNHNMFGLSRAGKYYKFKHWWESIIAYRFMVQDRYDGEDNDTAYLNWICTFYAEDTLYRQKILAVMKSNTNNY